MEPVRVPSVPAASFPLPPRLEGLRRLAYNLHWAWHPRTRNLWSLIDRAAWTRYRTPIPVISGAVDWTRVLDDDGFLAEYQDVLREFDAYMENGAGHWFQRNYAERLRGPIAYFCAEYGIHESLGIYSGGLGVLAGDHMKSASDMAMPVIGVGLLYRKGYFRQAIDADGHQEHEYQNYDLARLPLSRAQDQHGLPLTVTVPLPGRDLFIAVWLAQVGRVPVLLLDTDVAENAVEDRPITDILYVRGREMRLHQELVLGIGGVRAIRALHLEPAVWHLNEGHSAFLLAERASEYVRAGASLDDAWARVRSNSVFTIHTPVAAGNERFEGDLVRHVAGPLLQASGVDPEQLLRLGRGTDDDPNQFDMTAFCLRLTNGANAVSQLHGETANATWSEVISKPILAITNGVHGPSWVGQPIVELVGRHLGVELDALDAGVGAERIVDKVERIPATDLWEAHVYQKRELAIFARSRLRSQLARHGEAPSTLHGLENALDPNIMTVGFARRFATYKRAGLLFSDPDRLARLVWDTDRPVQFVFAGKAHPADRPGQRVIQEIFQRSRSPELQGRVFILENYDMRVGRFLVQGVDAWLNNPRRPLEASGTSGMKAAQNGVPNISILDGWWDEGYTGDNGWAIGGRESDPDDAAQAWADANSLYELLEQELVPRYYERDEHGVPRRWIEIMRRSMATTLWRFSTTRMLEEYAEQLYLPAAGIEVGRVPDDPLVIPAG
jgi:starch phosphorylase